MAKIIVTSRYIKPGSPQMTENYVKYIATREGAVPTTELDPEQGVSQAQQQLIQKMLNDFPDMKESLEYEDYANSTNMKTASELISSVIDKNMDQMYDKSNYITYLANRPGSVAVKSGGHALFSGTDDPISLNKVAAEVSEHTGNVWTHVVSLRREQAEQMGYNNLEAWRNLVIRHIPDIAKAQKIDLNNLKWYAAFHDKETNPHVHIVVYSKDDKEGYLTKQGIEKIRSVFANDIYFDELHCLNEKQTAVRDTLKQEMAKMAFSLSHEPNLCSPELIQNMEKLKNQLSEAKGKKVYKYLRPGIKDTVDEIYKELAQNERVKDLYGKWYELEQAKQSTYHSKTLEPEPLHENRNFYSVKNTIIREAQNLNEPHSEFTMSAVSDEAADAVLEPKGYSDFGYAEPTDDYIDVGFPDPPEAFSAPDVPEPATPGYCMSWSENYKEARALRYKENYDKALELYTSEADKGNVLAIYDIGCMYEKENFGKEEKIRAEAFFRSALTGFESLKPEAGKLQPYIDYRIGKMYQYGQGTQQDYRQAFAHYEKAAESGNRFAQYSLGGLYYYGNGVEQDYEKAYAWYSKSALQGNAYAAYSVGSMLENGTGAAKDPEAAQGYFKSAYASFLASEENDNILYKLGYMTKNGKGVEIDMPKAVEFFRRSAELGNARAEYELAKQLITGEYVRQDIEGGIILLEKCAKDNPNADYALAKLYLEGEYVPADIYKAINHLEKSAHQNNNAAYMLGKLYTLEEYKMQDFDKAEYYLTLSAKENNRFAQYMLGRLYLQQSAEAGKQSLKDMYVDRAVAWFMTAIEQGNTFAACALAKLYVSQERHRNIPEAIKLFESAANENSAAAYSLGMLYLKGESGDRDVDKAIEWFNQSAQMGNPYAQYMLDHINDGAEQNLGCAIISLFAQLGKTMNNRTDGSHASGIDRKLAREIIEKERSLGQKADLAQRYQGME